MTAWPCPDGEDGIGSVGGPRLASGQIRDHPAHTPDQTNSRLDGLGSPATCGHRRAPRAPGRAHLPLLPSDPGGLSELPPHGGPSSILEAPRLEPEIGPQTHARAAGLLNLLNQLLVRTLLSPHAKSGRGLTRPRSDACVQRILSTGHDHRAVRFSQDMLAGRAEQ